MSEELREVKKILLDEWLADELLRISNEYAAGELNGEHADYQERQAYDTYAENMRLLDSH